MAELFPEIFWKEKFHSAIFGISGVPEKKNETEDGMMFDMISPEEVDSYRYRPDVWLIDLRREEAYQKEHIDGAYSVPYERLIGGKSRLPENGLLILYCERGPTSFAAARDLAAQGYRVCALVGGIRAWRKYRDQRGRE